MIQIEHLSVKPANTGLEDLFPHHPGNGQPSFLGPNGGAGKSTLIKGHARTSPSFGEKSCSIKRSQPSSSTGGLRRTKRQLLISTSPSRLGVCLTGPLPPIFLSSREKAKRISKKVEDAFEKLVNLLDLADRQIGQLSGGAIPTGSNRPLAWSKEADVIFFG